MKSAIAVVFALLVAGCASGPYYSGGYGSYGYYDPYPAYGYGYDYGYGPSYTYDYPLVGGSIYYYDRDDRRDGRWRDGRWRDRDDDRGHWRDRDRDDDRGRWRDRGGSNNSPDLYRPGEAARGRGEAGNEAGM